MTIRWELLMAAGVGAIIIAVVQHFGELNRIRVAEFRMQWGGSEPRTTEQWLAKIQQSMDMSGTLLALTNILLGSIIAALIVR
jgi:hypothetical protein